MCSITYPDLCEVGLKDSETTCMIVLGHMAGSASSWTVYTSRIESVASGRGKIPRGHGLGMAKRGRRKEKRAGHGTSMGKGADTCTIRSDHCSVQHLFTQ